ncbi:helix-turn-helix domain-containing protein [Paenibacillus flagellatus]|uniref:HTH araC/xylS-type domain-containing protein n=1 Tax=Paenibacillus flagellatus TaxID=2211139 RepID=A0A2V5K2E3_9BACL|nr:helix-turn-helix domain-containing protein [Paenibacillus flagellatus]PYI53435.1 hypothetical protein DLM86_16805 [Paenibacillus flagellatus]
MPKKWFYRLILSYIPIFFAAVFCLMLLFFMTMNELTKRQSLKAGELFAGQVMQIVESTLKSVDTMASKNLLLNEKVAAFFASPGEQPTYAYYEATDAIRDFMEPLPMIDSVYLYRAKDGKVLLDSFTAELATFGDREFVAEAMRRPGLYWWSGIRSMRPFSEDNPTRPIVSLVKKVPYYSGEQGLIVVNVRAGSLEALLRDMNLNGGASLCLADDTGASFAGPDRRCVPAGEQRDADRTVLTSSYTGWSLYAGLQKASGFAFVSALSYVWVVLGFAVVAGGIAAMTYISHRHYRPLEQVLRRIHAFAAKPNALVRKDVGGDEFDFIGSALESLIEQTNSFEKAHEEGVLYRRLHLFRELMEGTVRLSAEEWSRETEKLGIEGRFECAIVAVAEIDGFQPFTERYSRRDQALFKFTLRGAIQEIVADAGESVWAEWMAPNRLVLLYRISDAAGARQSVVRIKALSERAKSWVEQYLAFTVTFGIGEPAYAAGDVPDSYKQASAAAERKVSLGPNAVYVYDPQFGKLSDGTGVDNLVTAMRETAQLFRLGNPDWEPLLSHTLQTIAAGVYAKEDVASLVRMLKTQIRREMQELPQEYRDIWTAGGLAELERLPDEFEWIEEVRRELVPILREADRQLRGLRMGREQYSLAARARDYVAEHYGNPDLSLALLGEAFDTNVKTLSRIFKEEFGEKFVDYLAKVRMEHAKRLLTETQEPVQSVSEKVGYLHTMSFIRAFKKLVGTTPGDFRKERGG